MKTYTVGVFEHQRKRSIRLMAYTRYYNPAWAGCCEHTVKNMPNGEAAKKFAMAVHRTLCMAQREKGDGRS